MFTMLLAFVLVIGLLAIAMLFSPEERKRAGRPLRNEKKNTENGRQTARKKIMDASTEAIEVDVQISRLPIPPPDQQRIEAIPPRNNFEIRR